MSRIFARFSWVLIGFLVLAYITLGIRGIYSRFQSDHRPTDGPFASSDSWLGDALDVNRPSQAVVEALSYIPVDASILFVGPIDDSHFLQTYYLVGYLGWPRRVSAVGCAQSGAEPTVMREFPESAPVTAVVFYRLAPAANLAQAQAVGSRLWIVRTSGITAWKSYCP